jgi:tight adherence protein B
MGAALGLMLGVGLLLVWTAFVVPSGERRPRRSRLRERLDTAGMVNTAPSTVVAASVAAALVVKLAVLLVSRTPLVALVFALMAGYAPYAWLGARLRRRRQELAEIWPDAVDNLASAVRAGLSLPDALSGLGERGPEALREPFRVFTRDYQSSGRFSESLDALKDRLADPVGDRVVEGLRVAREVGGGDLGRLLRTMSGQLRDEARTRAELVSRQSWAVNGARMAVAAPWLVLLLMSFQPEVVGRYSSPAGAVVLAIGALTCFVAYRSMLRIGQLPVERRVLS